MQLNTIRLKMISLWGTGFVEVHGCIWGTGVNLSTTLNPTMGDKIESDKAVTDRSKVDFTEGGVESFKFYPDKPENHRHKYRWSSKEASKYYDPCEESRQASISCLLRNQRDKLVCQDFFDAYRECTKDFFRKKREDKSKGKKGWGAW